MTSENDLNEPVYLYLPNHLIMEEPWKNYLENHANFLKGLTPLETGIRLYLDSEDLDRLAFSLVLKSCKQESTSKKSHISLTQEE